MIHLHQENEHLIEFRDGFVVKLLAHGLLLLLAALSVILLPVGGSLWLSNGLGSLCHHNALGWDLTCHDIQAAQVTGVSNERVRHRPGSGPPSLSSRLELHMRAGQTIPLTRHYQSADSGLSRQLHELQRYLQAPEGTFAISQDDRLIVVASASAIGLYSLYALFWGVRQHRILVQLDRGRLIRQRRGLLMTQRQEWPIPRIDCLLLETRSAGRKASKVRPAVRLQGGGLYPLLPYSRVSEPAYRRMLEIMARSANLPLK